MRKGLTVIELLIVVAVVFVIIALLVRGLWSTSWMAKHWGGTTSITIPAGWKLVNMTWHDANMWALIQNEKTGEMEFKEYSSFGIIQGTVLIKQQ